MSLEYFLTFRILGAAPSQISLKRARAYALIFAPRLHQLSKTKTTHNNMHTPIKPNLMQEIAAYDALASKARPRLTQEIYTINETAKILHYSPKSVARLIESGRLVHCKNAAVTGTKRQMRVPRASIEHFWDSLEE